MIGRSRFRPRALVREKTPAEPDRRLLAAILWGGVLLVVIAFAGLLFPPIAEVVWILLVVFAIAAVPQFLRATRDPDEVTRRAASSGRRRGSSS